MPNLNKVQLMGNMTRDVELKYTPSGMAVCKISIAINHKWRDNKTNEMREEVTYVEVEFWGKQAETLDQYVTKGKSLYIEGRLKLESWDDKTTGKKVYKMKVVGEQFQFLSPKSEGSSSGPPPVSRPAERRAAQKPQAKPADDFVDDISEESVPF